jgi:hypothetical protein
MADEVLRSTGPVASETAVPGQKKKPQLFLSDKVLEELMLIKTLTCTGGPQNKSLSASGSFNGTPAPAGSGGEEDSTHAWTGDQFTSSTQSIQHDAFNRAKSASFPVGRSLLSSFSRRTAVATTLPPSSPTHQKGSKVLRRLSNTATSLFKSGSFTSPSSSQTFAGRKSPDMAFGASWQSHIAWAEQKSPALNMYKAVACAAHEVMMEPHVSLQPVSARRDGILVVKRDYTYNKKVSHTQFVSSKNKSDRRHLYACILIRMHACMYACLNATLCRWQ